MPGVSSLSTYREGQVNDVLGPLIGDADGDQHLGQIVPVAFAISRGPGGPEVTRVNRLRDQAVAGPLREQADTGGDEGAFPVARCLQQLYPMALRVFHLVADACLDLGELSVDKGVFAVAPRRGSAPECQRPRRPGPWRAASAATRAPTR